MKFWINFLYLSSLPLYCAQPADVQAELREKLRKRLERIEQQPPQAPAKKIVLPPAKKPVVKEEEKKAGAPPAKPVEPKAEEKKKVAEQKNIADAWNTIQSLLKKYSMQQPPVGKAIWDLFNSADWQAKEDIHSWDVPGKGSAWMIDPMFATLLDVYMTEYTSSNDRPTLVAIMGNIMPSVFGFGPAKDPAAIRAEQDKLQKVGPQTAAFLDPLIKARFGSGAPKPAAKPAAPAKIAVPPAKKSEPAAKKDGNGKEAKAAKEKKITDCLAALRKKYLDEFEQQRKQNMQLLFDITGMTEQQFNENAIKGYSSILMAELVDLLNFSQYPRNGKYYDLTQKLLEEAGLKPNEIMLLSGPRKGLSSLGNNIMIDELQLNQMTPAAVKFALLHEIHHIKAEDSLNLVPIQELLRGTTAGQEFESLWRYFIETRADIMAALTSKEMAQGYLEYFELLPQAGQFQHSHSHLHHAQRAAFAMKLLAEVLQCYE